MLQFTIEAISDLYSLRKCLKEMYLSVYNPYSLANESKSRYISFRDGLNVCRVPVAHSNIANSTKRYTSMLCGHVASLNLNITDESDESLLSNIIKEFQQELHFISDLADDDADFEIEASLIKECLLQIKASIFDKIDVIC